MFFCSTYSNAQELKIIHQAELVKLVSADSGKVIVNFWATWCKPCVQEMPAFVKADSQFSNSGLSFVFVSFDFVEDSTRVKKFIANKKLPGFHYLIDETDMNRLINAVDSSWSGGLPATWFLNNKRKWSYYSHFENYNDLNTKILDLFATKYENE